MNVLIRADASLHMGTGHIMRCVTLAKQLSAEGARVVFCCIEQAGDLISWLESEHFEVRHLCVQTTNRFSEWLPWSEEEDAHSVVQAFNPQDIFDWIIVDHYGLSSAWHGKLKAFTKRLFVIDDLANRAYDADLLLDQNLGRTALNYRERTRAKVLAGTLYALLREEFIAARAHATPRVQVRRLLIALGGVDEHNYTSQILELLADNKAIELRELVVVLGSTAPHIERVRALVDKRFAEGRVQVLQGVNNMAELMVNADLCIGAAGTTSWERCCLGLPTLVLELADNQRIAAEALVKEGVAEHIHVAEIESLLLPTIERLIATPEKIQKMSTLAMNLVDGQGVRRVMSAMNEVLA